MKSAKSVTLVFILIISIAATSCKKGSGSDPNSTTQYQLSSSITNIISQNMINKFVQRGLKINDGLTPPTITGTFTSNPHTLQSPYTGDSYKTGDVIPDYIYHIYNQSGSNVTIDWRQNGGADVATGLGSFISGSGNSFTLFCQSSGVSTGISYKIVTIISGTITSTGIADFQTAFVLTDKTGDSSNSYLLPIGEGRIWKDGNGLATKN